MILPCVNDDCGCGDLCGDGGYGGDGGGRRAWTACSTLKRGSRKGEEEPRYPCSKVWNINIAGIGA